jgi:hypothetical protein
MYQNLFTKKAMLIVATFAVGVVVGSAMVGGNFPNIKEANAATSNKKYECFVNRMEDVKAEVSAKILMAYCTNKHK